MQTKISLNVMCILCFFSFLMTAPMAFAEDDSKLYNETKEEKKEIFAKPTIKKVKINNFNGNATKKPKIFNQRNQTSYQIPPLKMLVKQIVGNDENSRYAVVEFEGDEIKIVKNQVIKGKIKVVDIFSDRVVVYSVSEQRRHTYRLVTE